MRVFPSLAAHRGRVAPSAKPGVSILALIRNSGSNLPWHHPSKPAVRLRAIGVNLEINSSRESGVLSMQSSQRCLHAIRANLEIKCNTQILRSTPPASRGGVLSVQSFPAACSRAIGVNLDTSPTDPFKVDLTSSKCLGIRGILEIRAPGVALATHRWLRLGWASSKCLCGQ